MYLKELITAHKVSINEFFELEKRINNSLKYKNYKANLFEIKRINAEHIYVLEFLFKRTDLCIRIKKLGKLVIKAHKELLNDEFVLRVVKNMEKEFNLIKKGESK